MFLKIITRLALILVIAISLFSCNHKQNQKVEIETLLKKEVPMSSDVNAVSNFLGAHNIKHSRYITSENKRFIYAEIPKVEKTFYSRKDLYIEFNFSQEDKLVGYFVKELETSL